MLEEKTEAWWKSAIFYQIYPRSFADTNGDGVGDLEGVRRHLDYLEWLGVDAIWMSPFYRSPMADFGYDISDYCAVDPLFGSLDDFDALLAAVHERGMRLIIDWVPNHTSDRHPWFVDSRSSLTSGKRDWYIWRDPKADGSKPNNWRAAFTDAPDPTSAMDPEHPEGLVAPRHTPRDTSAWTLDEKTGQYYLHLFLPEQPDLNWRNPEVQNAMHNVLRFWLDRGVDGFRIDVIHCIAKDPDFPDDPVALLETEKSSTNDEPDTHPLIRDIRKVIDSYPGDRMAVGEVYLFDAAKVARYYGAGDELHLAFNFVPLASPWEGGEWHERIDEARLLLEPIQAWPTWVLSNHDKPRHRTRYGGSEEKARAAAIMLLSLRGTPFLFAGEELGLEDAVIPPARQVDPGGRDGCRAPIPWVPDAGYGWDPNPWLPFPPEPDKRNVESMQQDPASILHLYRRMISVRQHSLALEIGAIEELPTPEDVVLFERCYEADSRWVAVNFSDQTQTIELPGPAVVQVASDRVGEGESFAGVLGPYQAVVLRPRNEGLTE